MVFSAPTLTPTKRIVKAKVKERFLKCNIIIAEFIQYLRYQSISTRKIYINVETHLLFYS